APRRHCSKRSAGWSRPRVRARRPVSTPSGSAGSGCWTGRSRCTRACWGGGPHEMRTVATADALQWGDAQGRAGRPARILHVLDHSLPEQSGYASRSHAILLSLNRLGLDVEAITSPKHGVPGTAVEEIDGIRYRRTPSGSETSGVAGQLRTVLATRRHLKRYLLDRKPALVHAHSPCLNGLSAAALGHPLVYEMRSSWEDAAVSSGTTT